MNETKAHYMRCVYCGREGSHSKKVGKSVGLFRIKQLYSNVLILECMKCSKVCRIQKIGATLQWADMSPEERLVHTKKAWVSYTKTKLQEEKHGKEI